MSDKRLKVLLLGPPKVRVATARDGAGGACDTRAQPDESARAFECGKSVIASYLADAIDAPTREYRATQGEEATSRFARCLRRHVTWLHARACRRAHNRV